MQAESAFHIVDTHAGLAVKQGYDYGCNCRDAGKKRAFKLSN